MKTTTFSAAVLFTLALLAGNVSAQSPGGIYIPGLPAGIWGGSGGGGYSGYTTRPVPFTTHRTNFRGQRIEVKGLRWMERGVPRETILSETVLPNSIAADTGKKIDRFSIDPFTGRVVVDTSRTTVYDSASDRLRDVIDPGSKRYVDRTEVDPRTGGLVRTVGWTWTSYGTPHSDLKRITVSSGPGGIEERSTERRVTSPGYRP